MKFTVHQAKTNLSKLIQKALAGEEVIIANREVPLVKLEAITSPKRRLGFIPGKIEIADDFNETPEDFKEYL